MANSNNDVVRFVLDGKIHEVSGIEPTTTVLNYLREDMHRTGTKEGCAEGDCGACTVVMVELKDGQLQARAINACIQFVPTLNGKALFTVESLKTANDGNLHPIQQSMVDLHGSQCGFCTPGFIMSLFALYKNNPNPSREDIDDALSGNLCRCTGYRPIIDAATEMYAYNAAEDNWTTRACATVTASGEAPGERELIDLLESIKPAERLTVTGQKYQFFAPTTIEDMGALVEQYPDATILAGGTDVGLWVTKQLRDLPVVIYLGAVEGLDRVEVTDTHIEIDAAATLTDAYGEITKHYPELTELHRRFASTPIRNAGTLVGNVANGSPIGDTSPALISLGASIILRKGNATRELPLDEFYLGYQVKAMEAGEFVQSVRIPLPQEDRLFRLYKISKRFDQDISAVCGAFSIVLKDNIVSDARITFGGMAATTARAARCEAALNGKEWNESNVEAAMAELEQDYTPLKDMRASAEYRTMVSSNLLKKFYLETCGQDNPTSVLAYSAA